MSVKIIDTLKPKNNGSFPIVEAVDVSVSEDLRLPEALDAKADVSALAETDAIVASKANSSDVETATSNLQGQINQIVISASTEAVVAPEVSAARSDKSGVSYSTLKDRIDAESDKSQSIESDLIATSIISLDEILDYSYQNTLSENTVEYARLGSYDFQHGKTYKIIVDFTSVTWKSTNDAYVEVVALDANSYTAGHVVERIREQSESLAGNKLEIIYVPTVNNAKYINFKFNLGAGTQNITVKIYERKASEVTGEVEAARTAGSIEYSTLKDRLDASDNAIALKSDQTEVTALNENISYLRDNVSSGKESLKIGWAHGGWNTADGWNSHTYRIHNTSALSFAYPVTIYVKSGFRIYGITDDLTSTLFGWVEGESWIRVAANTSFYLQVGRTPENTSENADAIEFSNAVYIVSEYEKNITNTSVAEKNTWNTGTGKEFFFKSSDFEVGDIDGSTGTIIPNSTTRYRIRSNKRIYSESDMFISISENFSARFFLYPNAVDNTSTPSPAWKDGFGTVLIPKGTYFTVVVKRTTEDNSEVLLNHEEFLEKISYSTYLRKYQRGYNLLRSGYERGGMITSGTNSGKINPNEKYRVSSSDLLYADTEQMIYLYKPNVEYNFYPCNSDGTVIRTSNWQRKGYLRIVEAGTYYKITLQRNPKNTAEVLTEEAAKEMWEAIGIVDSFSEKQLKYSVSDLNASQKLAVQNFSTSRPKQLSNISDPVPLELLHFSDVHANRFNWDRVCEYIDDNDDIIAAAIHTGDYVAVNQQSVIDLYSRKLPKKLKILNVVGNHDSYADDNNTLADKSSTYDICFSNVTGWDVTFGTDTNAMYYYKDFASSNIRLIVLDQYYWDATEAEWLETVLADAKSNGLSVVTAMHTPTETIIKANQINCTFKGYDDWTGRIPTYSTPVSAIIKDFIDGGGLYICNLCGHFHFDIIGYDSNGVLNVTVPCATYDDSGGWQTTKRIPLEKSGDCFNVVGIDVSTHTIRIARIGSNLDYFGQRKNILCIDYTDGTVLANS